MNKINNYQELVAERIRLEGELQLQKAVLTTEMTAIKNQLEPLVDFVSILGVFKKKENGISPLIKIGVSLGIDLLSGKLLAQSNWLTRGVLPNLIKGLVNRFSSRKSDYDKAST
jgi:hypothetical protein